MSLLLLRIPNDDDLFNIDVSRHAVFFQVKDVAFDLGRLAGDRNSHTANLDLFAQAVFKKIPHSNYSSVIWVSMWPRFYLIVFPMRNLMAPRGLGQDARERDFPMWPKRSTQWMFIFGAWTLPGFYFAIQVYLQQAYEAHPITLTQALLRGIVFWLLWVVSSPLI